MHLLAISYVYLISAKEPLLTGSIYRVLGFAHPLRSLYWLRDHFQSKGGCTQNVDCPFPAQMLPLAELLWQFASDFASVFCVCVLNSHYYYYYRASLLFCDLSISMSTWQQQKITQSMRFEICNQPSQLEMEILEFIGLNHCSSWAAPTHHGPSLVERTQSKISTVHLSRDASWLPPFTRSCNFTPFFIATDPKIIHLPNLLCNG